MADELRTMDEVILLNLPPGNNFDYRNAGCIYPATGIMLVGTILKRHGYSVSLIDGALYKNYEEMVFSKISKKTAFIGFSAMTSQIVVAYNFMKKIKKKYPKVLIVLGGIHATLFPEQVVDNPYIDIAVCNEGGSTALEIMDYVNGKIEIEKIKGISFSNNHQSSTGLPVGEWSLRPKGVERSSEYVDGATGSTRGESTSKGNLIVNAPRELESIDDTPHFDFELLDVSHYLNARSVYERELNADTGESLRLMPILAGLGCCFKCRFCVNVILKRRYRLRSAKSIVEEIKRLQSKYDANAFLFLDEDFCINKKRLAEFIKLAKEENLEFSGRIWSRVSYFRQDSFIKMLPELEEIGIRSIAMGAESGSQKMLDYMKKDIKVDEIPLAAKKLNGTKIVSRFSFMVGMETESKKDTVDTYRMCVRLFSLNPLVDIAGPFLYRYYPGSAMFNEMAEKYNVKLPASIEEWNGVLNDDGSLILEEQPWLWPGFLKYYEAMRIYINFYTRVLTKRAYRDNPVFQVIKKFILFRISSGENLFIIDYHIFKSIKLFRKVLRKFWAKNKIFLKKES